VLFLDVLGQVIREVFPLDADIRPATSERPVTLRVVNPRAPESLTEDIGCDFTEDGWWFVWQWGEGDYAGQTIGPAEDPKGVARAVANVVGLRHVHP
jgi:hypothetical protein